MAYWSNGAKDHPLNHLGRPAQAEHVDDVPAQIDPFPGITSGERGERAKVDSGSTSGVCARKQRTCRFDAGSGELEGA